MTRMSRSKCSRLETGIEEGSLTQRIGQVGHKMEGVLHHRPYGRQKSLLPLNTRWQTTIATLEHHTLKDFLQVE